jgi:alpha-mannosidase
MREANQSAARHPAWATNPGYCRGQSTFAVRRLVVGLSLTLLLWGLGSTRATSQTASNSSGPVFYLIPFSHLDLFWGGTREEDLARGCQILSKAMMLARQSPKFRFLMEDEVMVANYVESHQGSPDLAELKRLVKTGRIEVAPKWAGIFQGLPDGEVLARNLLIGKRYARETFGVDPQVAHMGDIPGYTRQFPQVLSQARVPYMVMPRMGPTDKSLFYYQSPDGSKVLVWNALKGYGWGTFLTSPRTSDPEKLQHLQRDLNDLRRNYSGPVFINWGSDLFVPQDDLVAQVERFDTPGPMRMIISTPTEFFREAEKVRGIPETSGEIPDSWPNIVPSLAHMWPQIVPATATLLAAEKFAAINSALGYAEYPQHDLDFLWKRLIESMDHNHDGQGGKRGDDRKLEYMQLSLLRGGEILRDNLRNIAERVQFPFSNSVAIVVFNPLGWSRSDLARTHLTVYGDPAPGNIAAFRKGMRLLDETGLSIPFHVEEYSENISRAHELVFVAQDVPSLGYRTYYLVAADVPDSFSVAAKVALDDDKDRLEPRRTAGTNTLENSFYRLTVDRATGRVTLFDKDLNRDVCRNLEVVADEERGGNYIGIEPLSGRTLLAAPDSVAVEENNPVRATVRLECRIADIRITQRFTLLNALKRLDLENTVEWQTPRFVRLEQLFPLAESHAALNYGVPFGACAIDDIMPNTGPRAGDEIKPDSWHHSRIVHDWIHAGGPGWGLNIATDHQQFRLSEGVIRAEMLRGTRFTSVKVVRGDEVTSLHYPPPGRYVFRYSLSSAPGDWKAAKAFRAGMNWNNPLLPVTVVDQFAAKTLPPTHSFCAVQKDNLVISALKKSDSDSSVLLRLYEIEGSHAETPVQFLGRACTFDEANLLEETSAPRSLSSLQFGPYAIKTIRLKPQP